MLRLPGSQEGGTFTANGAAIAIARRGDKPRSTGFAAIGIANTLSLAVHERTREIGLRVAVGATADDIVRLILRQGAVIASVGVLTGLVAAVALDRFFRRGRDFRWN